MINLEKTEKTESTLKWQLPLLFAFILAFSIPAHAGKIKFLLAPGMISTFFNDVNVNDYGSPDNIENKLGFGITFDIGEGPNTLAIDYYSTEKIYKYSGSDVLAFSLDGDAYEYVFDGDNDDSLRANSVLMGYRRHTDSGFYVGGGAIFINPSIYRELRTSGTAFNRNTGVSTPISTSNSITYDYIQAPAIAITLGYDHSFDNGMVIGGHLMRSLPVTVRASGNLADLEGFYLQSLSFGIGYDW